MFIVILAVAALADYVLTFCCIVNIVVKSTVKTEETPNGISGAEEEQPANDAVVVHIDDKEFNDYIEEQNNRIALLSFNVNEILSNIDAIIQEKK